VEVAYFLKTSKIARLRQPTLATHAGLRRRKMPETEIKELNPHQIIRYEDGPAFFGYRPTVLAEKIKEGSIPTPKYLAPAPSRARGWTGQQIIDHHRALDAAQAERATAAKEYYARKPKPGRRKDAAAIVVKPALAKPKVRLRPRKSRRSTKG
jgi:hypothetical protein